MFASSARTKQKRLGSKLFRETSRFEKRFATLNAMPFANFAHYLYCLLAIVPRTSHILPVFNVGEVAEAPCRKASERESETRPPKKNAF